MSESRSDTGFGWFVVLVVIPALILIFMFARAQWFTEGYCAALGGEFIKTYTCEVDGRVVRV